MNNKSTKRFILFIFLFLFFVPLEAQMYIQNPTDKLNVKIPGLDKLSEPNCYEEGNSISEGAVICEVSWIGEYINAIYKYSIGIVGIIAVMAMMMGGIMWILSAGNNTKISEAKSYITGGISGVIILLSSYLILYAINPDLVAIKPIKTFSIKGVKLGGGWDYDPGIKNQVGDTSNSLKALLNCMRQNLPEGVGRISSISDSNYVSQVNTCFCDKGSACPTMNPSCVHSRTSCHYGGGLNDGKSYAVDFGDEENGTAIKKAAQECNAGFILDEGNHIHVSTSDCPRK